jgi:hypothetical protein
MDIELNRHSNSNHRLDTMALTTTTMHTMLTRVKEQEQEQDAAARAGAGATEATIVSLGAQQHCGVRALRGGGSVHEACLFVTVSFVST